MTDPQPAPLQPPATASALTLTAPAPPQPVAATAAPRMAPAVEAAALPGLDAKVDGYLAALLAAAPRSPEFAAKATDVRTMGDGDIRRAAETSNRLLKSPVKALQEGGLAEGSKVGSTLLELRRTIEDLDPKEATGAKKFLGMVPFGDKVTDYFRKYQSAQTHLDGILHALRDGQDELGKDNAALNLEKQYLWDAMARLNQYVYVAERLDARLAARIAELEATDPDKAKALRDDVLFYVRQKHQDLLTQLAVSIQNYLAIDIVIKNNIELIKGVDRASTTTVSALRTAVIVAQALGNQKLVLDQITALNTTTSGMIERTSEMLRDNSVQIQQQAASATIGLPQLQAAFANIYATMDAIDTFKVQALDTMAATIGTLETEVGKSQAYLERVQRQDERVASGSLDLGGTDGSWALRSRSGIVSTCRVGSSAASSAAARNVEQGDRFVVPAVPTSADLLASLDRVEAMVAAGAVPAPVASRVRRVDQVVRDTIPRLPSLGAGSPQAYSVMATATDYLPEAVGGYLRLPRQFADSRPVDRGKSSLMVLIDQLDLLAATMDKVFDAVCRADADALVAHGRFLAEKFGSASTGGALDVGSAPLPPMPRLTPGVAAAVRMPVGSGASSRRPGGTPDEPARHPPSTPPRTATLAEAVDAVAALASTAGVDAGGRPRRGAGPRRRRGRVRAGGRRRLGRRRRRRQHPGLLRRGQPRSSLARGADGDPEHAGGPAVPAGPAYAEALAEVAVGRLRRSASRRCASSATPRSPPRPSSRPCGTTRRAPPVPTRRRLRAASAARARRRRARRPRRDTDRPRASARAGTSSRRGASRSCWPSWTP